MGFAQGEGKMEKKDLMEETKKILPKFKKVAESCLEDAAKTMSKFNDLANSCPLSKIKEIVASCFDCKKTDGSNCVYILRNNNEIGCIKYKGNYLVFEFDNSHPEGKKTRYIEEYIDDFTKPYVLTDADIKSAIFNTPKNN